MSSNTSKFRLALHSGINHRTPIGFFSDYWQPYISYRVGGDLPVGVDHFFVRFDIDAGTISSARNINLPLVIIRPAFLTGYSFDLGSRVCLKPLAGVTSTLVNPDQNLYINDKPFSASESEFGFIGGSEITLHARRLSVSGLLFYDHVFSRPEPFKSVSAAINLGYQL
jgi:hypothetical protein